MIETEIQPEPAVKREEVDTLTGEPEPSALDMLALLIGRKRFIARFVLGSAVFSVALAFLWPVRYEGKVLLLPPNQDSSIGSALLGMGQLGGSMGSGLGSLASLASGSLGLKSQADMYVSMLTSRTVEDALIRRFDLMHEYDKKWMADTRKVLERRTTAVAGTKDGLIKLTVEDRDPKRAADLANGYVEEFRRLSESLAITEAARRRRFFGRELEQAKADLAVAEEAMQKTQQKTGVLQIDSQARALIESAALLRAQVVAKQVQIESMRSFAAEDNPELVLAKKELAALQQELQQEASSPNDAGSDINLSKGRVTEAGLEYLRKYRDLKYRETVFELLSKEFEIARLDEAREGSIVQVVDAAVPPDKRSSPHRTLIVIGITVLGSLAAGFWVIMRERLARTFALPENQERLERIKELWRAKQDAV